MKESYSIKRKDVGTDAAEKNRHKIIQFIKDSPAKSILLGITGVIFLKNVLYPYHGSRDVGSHQDVDGGQADASGLDPSPGMPTVLSDGLPHATEGLFQPNLNAGVLAGTSPSPMGSVAQGFATQDAELTVRLSDPQATNSALGAQDRAEFQWRDPNAPLPEPLPAQASAEWMDTLLGVLGLFAGRSALASSGSATAQSLGGFVIDGYISGATVYRDDGKGNPLGGITQTTDASGHYGALPEGSGKLVVVANSTSIDQSTGKAFTAALTLYAPGNASVINPITTLIQNSVEQGKTLAEATAAITKGLGLGAGVDYLHFDPISTFTTATGTAQADAFKVQLAATQIANLMITGAAALSLASSGANPIDNATASKSVLDKLVAVATSSSVALDLSQASTLNSVFADLNVSASAVALIASANKVVGNTLQDLYNVQSIIQGTVMEISNNPSANALTAFNSLTELVSMVNNPDPTARQQILKIALLDSMNLGDGPNSHVSYNAAPVMRVSLSGVKDVAVLDKIYLHDDADNLSAFHEVTAADLAQGFVDIAFAELPVRDGILISATLGHTSTKSFATGFTSISKSTPSLTQDVGVDSTSHLTLTGQLAALTGSTGVDTATGNWGSLTVLNDGSYTYRVANSLAKPLADGEVHTDTFTVKLGSSSNATLKTLSFEVAGTNDAPIVTAGLGAATEDGAPVVFDALSIASDLDHGAVLQVVDVPATLPAGVSYIAQTHQFSFDPSHAAYQSLAAGQVLSVPVTFGVSDGTSTTQATVTFKVTGLNDAPAANAASDTAMQDGALVTGQLSASDVDVLGKTATYTLDAPVAGLTLKADGSYSFDPSDAAYQSLAKDEVKAVVVHFTVTDDQGASSGQTLTLRVTGINDAPVANAASNQATQDGAVVTGQLSASDVDVLGKTATYILDAPVAGLTLKADGSYSFDPSHAAYQSLAKDEVKAVVAHFTVTDDQGASSSQTLTLRVTGINDAPVLSTPSQTITLVQGSGAVADVGANVSASDVDGAAQDIVYSLVSPTRLFSIHPSTGVMSLTSEGAADMATLAAQGTLSVYTLSVSAADKFSGVSMPEVITVNVNMAVHADGVSATLPGALSDWSVRPALVLSSDPTAPATEGFLLTRLDHPDVEIKMAHAVTSLVFDDATLNLNNDGTAGEVTLGAFTASTTHPTYSITLGANAVGNSVVHLLANASGSVVGAADSFFDKDLGNQDNVRSDTVEIQSTLNLATFESLDNNAHVRVSLHNLQGAVVSQVTLSEVEVVKFSDATVVLVAADGYLSAAEALDHHDATPSNVYLYDPLHSVYHYT